MDDNELSLSINNKIKILLVDDHPVVRAGYKMLINNTSDIVVEAEADSSKDAYKKYCENDCDVVLMDWSMPDASGLEAIFRITSRDSRAKIMMITMHEELVFVEKAINAGAKGYVTKRSAPDIIIKAIRTLYKGHKFIEEGIAQQLVFNNLRGDDSVFSSLSTREFQIFCFIAEGLNINEIAKKISLGYKTVSNYSSQIKTKLNCGNTAEIAHLAIKNNIISA